MTFQTPPLSKQEAHLRAAADTSVSGSYADTLLSKPHAPESLLEQQRFPALASIRRPSRGLATNLNNGPQLCNAGTLVRRAADVSAQRPSGPVAEGGVQLSCRGRRPEGGSAEGRC